MRARFTALLLCGLAATLLAAPPAPPGPDAYNVQLRYAINAIGNERLEQYRDFRAALKKAGFTRDAREEEDAGQEAADPNVTRMTGTIAADQVADLRKVRWVRTILLWPAKTKLPAKDTRVRVDIALTASYERDFQRKLARQTADALKKAGFVEAVVYDHAGFTRLVGSVPGDSLGKLLDDVRLLVPRDERPSPFSLASPVRVVIAQPTWPVPSGEKKLPDVPRGQEKFSPDLRPLLGSDAKQRLEVILGTVPRDDAWMRRLREAGATVEGRTGQLVTVLASPKAAAKKLADLPEVAALRLPRRGTQAPLVPGTAAPAGWEALKASGVTSLHALGQRGKGARIVLIADDFAGWRDLKGDVKLIDLTAARSKDVLPDPYRGDRAEGHGTSCARAILKAAPEASLTLVRIDAAAPYMLEEVARAINGDRRRSIALEQRFAEQKTDREQLELDRLRLEELRREAISDDDLDEATRRKKREAYKAAQKAFDDAENAYRGRVRRAVALEAALNALKGARIVASALVWPDGHPVDGTSALSRYFDDRPFRAALWFQAAGDTAGQAWAGPFRDADGNGLVEMGDAKRLPKGSWSPELNFLAWRTATGQTSNLPAGARLRLTLQWREAHDPAPLRAGDDPYRAPLSNFRLVVVYQPDPAGRARPADDLDVVTYSVGAPQRLAKALTSGTYEHTVELDVKQPGRYAVYIEGTAAESIHAPGENVPPAMRKRGEVSLRLFVQTLAGNGRAVWSDFATKTASLGMPADARQVITVAAATADGAAQPASAGGSPLGVSLAAKPDALSYDEGAGTAAAASFAAGLAAAAVPRAGGYAAFLEALNDRPGQVLRAPGK